MVPTAVNVTLLLSLLFNRTCCSAAARKDELRLEDILYAVRRDPRKVSRIQVQTRYRQGP